MIGFNSPVRRPVLLLVLILLSVAFLVSEPGKVQVNDEALKMFGPLPVAMTSPDNPSTETKVKLGRILYYDARLSANQKISCNTCHPLDAYGADSTSVSTGFKNQKGKRNAPTVYNAAGHFVQFWDGPRPYCRGTSQRSSYQPC
jgi:cytochrome c peroxidase